ncbi:histidine phosphatase family protein [Microbispora sp. RL4-1S]|uniref:Histidine phosphatase family protein n=1 Tax=Microbispora oryzae TaxID=2806554 RepID=A0A940WKB0_9ACTN|nr:histidine phosphatase family protein [Microbispora oryzae]MBP2707254.1 histidine phosphatase family protein [Microbispora oryzae]
MSGRTGEAANGWPPGARTLVVVRHAKAGDAPGLPDRERPLTGRGERDARNAGDRVRPLEPDLVVASPSKRTRRTAELLGLDAPIEIERDIYEAYPEDLFALIRRTDPAVGTLVLVGHNPGVHELVVSLTRGEVDGFPPAALAVIELAGPWEEAGPGAGRLVGSFRP